MDMVQLDVERAKRKIQDMDLSFVERRLVNVEGCSPEAAREAVASYRRLLSLQVDYPQHRLAPPMDADRALHAHILHTQRYADDMNAIFGRFLHHDPAESNEETRELTRNLFETHYGISVNTFAMCIINIENREKLAA